MAQREREREQQMRADVAASDRPIGNFRDDLNDLQAADTTTTNPISSDQQMSNSQEVLFRTPDWLKGLFPIEWSVADANARKNDAVGRNCCLFYPLGYCRDSTDLVNGFCTFHLRAIFNLVYQTDSVYQINARGESSISQRTACFVSDPQPVNDEYTPIFPLMEIVGPVEMTNKDIKLYHLVKFLQSKNWPNWERVYAHHVNYVHRLITLYSPEQCNSRSIELRENQMSATQLMMHWNMWNEYHSKLLADYPVDINILYLTGEGNETTEDMLTVPLRKCTTITQMICRLFSEAYVNLNERRFYSTAPSYGIFTRNHWAYSNNMCSIGTHCTKGGVMCIGNAATANILRVVNNSPGGCRTKTIHYSNMSECNENMCMPPLINKDATMLNQAVTFATRT